MGQSCAIQLDFRTPQGAPVPRVSQPAARTSRREDSDQVPVFRSKDSVCGEIKITPIPGRRVDHQGIHVQLIGEIELASDRGRPHEFLSLVRDLSPPGELTTQLSLPFAFEAIELAHENYLGLKVRLRYLVRVSVLRGLGSTVTRDFPVAVRNPVASPVAGPPIKMEVGIEDCLHIEFEYDRGAFSLGDVVVGRIYFLLVRVKIKHMEVEIKRRETVGAGAQARSESETVAKYEIMDGAPARGEIIPIRLFLDPFDLTPSVENVHNRFSVKYFLNLVLVDDED
ncbi:vacuolar protein sorting-associated protein 26, partial [Helicosporidium sp. ATCC 50920]